MDNPQKFDYYMLISLVDSIYKIVSKNTCKKAEKSSWSSHRCKTFSFSKEKRPIGESVVVTNEVTEEVREKKGECIIFKVDF